MGNEFYEKLGNLNLLITKNYVQPAVTIGEIGKFNIKIIHKKNTIMHTLKIMVS